jgi:deoxycytidylate deaminase
VSGPCAKRHVWCEIETADERVFYGDNSCENPQAVCPREPGEGYEKCETICRQNGHAEVEAMARAREAGASLQGSTAFIGGHYYCCVACAEMMREAGVEVITIVEKGAHPWVGKFT